MTERWLFPFIRYQKCEKVLIEAQKPMGVCADGEISPHKTVLIESAPRAVSFSVPKGCRCLALADVCTEINFSENKGQLIYEKRIKQNI